MSATAWMVLLSLALVIAVAVAARLGPFGARFGHDQACSVVCPTLRQTVDCRMAQEVYTGQWQTVKACSAFPGWSDLPCDKGCARMMNLGFPLSPPRA